MPAASPAAMRAFQVHQIRHVERRHGGIDIQQAPAIDLIHPGGAEVLGREQQKVGHVFCFEPAPATEHKRGRAGDQRCREGRACNPRHIALAIRGEQQFSGGDQEAVHQPVAALATSAHGQARCAGAVGEGRDFTIGVDRSDDQKVLHRPDPGPVEVRGLGLPVIAGGYDQQGVTGGVRDLPVAENAAPLLVQGPAGNAQ